MKQDSRNERGKGKRRKVHGTAEKVAKRIESPDLEPAAAPAKPTRAELREKIIEELAGYALDACKTIGTSQKRGGLRAPRGSGGDSANAKWLLETLFEKLSETPPEQASGAPNTPGATPVAGQVDELAARRTELRNLLRQQRNALNK